MGGKPPSWLVPGYETALASLRVVDGLPPLEAGLAQPQNHAQQVGGPPVDNELTSMHLEGGAEEGGVEEDAAAPRWLQTETCLARHVLRCHFLENVFPFSLKSPLQPPCWNCPKTTCFMVWNWKKKQTLINCFLCHSTFILFYSPCTV